LDFSAAAAGLKVIDDVRNARAVPAPRFEIVSRVDPFKVAAPIRTMLRHPARQRSCG
jgi:hypothetical protein